MYNIYNDQDKSHIQYSTIYHTCSNMIRVSGMSYNYRCTSSVILQYISKILQSAVHCIDYNVYFIYLIQLYTIFPFCVQ